MLPKRRRPDFTARRGDRGHSPLESPVDESLHVERASTSAGRFHLRIVELEARAFERVYKVHFNAIQVLEAGLVDKDFQPVRVVRLVQHAWVVLESHRVAEAGATSADDRDPQPGWPRRLRLNDLLDLTHRSFC